METLNSKTYHAAVYLRLSREDGDVAEGSRALSNSISNQKELVMDYLRSHAEIQVYSVYTDDGWSGVDFQRPEFQRMLSDIREGSVDCVVVKDLSRFGRNYIESGRYIEKIFPMLGVRFIAVNDGYDSLDGQYGNDMVIPFKNLINDAYCRDISVKIRSHMEVKRKNGEYIGAFAAYGYLKDPEDKNHLVVDGYAADVVRDIFAMKLAGCSLKAIADRLNRDGILSPLQYKKSIGIRLESSFQKDMEPKWSYNAVLRILKNEVYVGTVVQGKCTTPNYKVKKRVYKDESEWVRVGDAHEAIVGRSEFELVQSLLARDTRVSPKKGKVFPLAGMVFCGGCGEPMVRKTVPSGDKRYVYYVCSGHKNDRASCSSHSFSAKKLEESVLALVQTFIGKVLMLSEAADIVSRASGMAPDVGKIESRIAKLREEAEDCGRRRKNLYEDFKDGILTKEEYAMLREQYQEQADGMRYACGVCGKRLTRRNGTDLYCNRGYMLRDCECRQVVMKEPEADAIVLGELKRKLRRVLDEEELRLEKRADVLAAGSRVESLRNALEAAKKAKQKLFEKLVDREIERAVFLERKKGYDAEIGRLEQEISDAGLAERIDRDADGEARERADVARSFLDVGEMTEEIWERFVKGACVYPDGRIEVRWNFGDEME